MIAEMITNPHKIAYPMFIIFEKTTKYKKEPMAGFEPAIPYGKTGLSRPP